MPWRLGSDQMSRGDTGIVHYANKPWSCLTLNQTINPSRSLRSSLTVRGSLDSCQMLAPFFLYSFCCPSLHRLISLQQGNALAVSGVAHWTWLGIHGLFLVYTFRDWNGTLIQRFPVQAQQSSLDNSTKKISAFRREGEKGLNMLQQSMVGHYVWSESQYPT